MKPIRVLLLYASGEDNATFSYQTSWPRQFAHHPRFECSLLNLADRRPANRLRGHWLIRRWRGDAVVLMHSVFSNACYLTGRLLDAVAAVDRPKVYFVGNEYKLMAEKMAFAETLRVPLLVTQSSSPAVQQMYRDRLGCQVIGIPNTGLDSTVFFPSAPTSDRPIDLGYRSQDSPIYLGHQERREIAEYFEENASRFGLTVDISLDDASRFAEAGWAGFLNRCKGQLGTEAGGDYFDLDDSTRYEVIRFLDQNPGAGLDRIRERFFAESRPATLRLISGRNVEAAGTRTAQLLFEGEYGGYLQPDVHYIPLKKDFSNADEAIGKFRDAAFRETIVENAYQLARSELTYDRLIDRFHDALAPLL
jgi:hypothetical protein